MREVMKLSELTVEDVADYIHLAEVTEDDHDTLKTLLGIAKQYIKSYTGRTDEEMDNYQDFVIVALVLCQDMFDNRTMYVDNTSLNVVVESILGMHSVNLL